MASESASLGEPRVRDASLPSTLITLVVVIALVAWMAQFSERWLGTWASDWPSLLFWICMVVAIDLFPIRVGSLVLTLDVPVLLAVALLFTPEVAASVACVAALDMRELKGRVRIGRALYNRAQVAWSVLVAGHVLHVFGPDVTRTQSLILPTLIALLADYAVNATLVAAVRAVDVPPQRFLTELWGLKVGSWWEFLGTYLAYGLLAVLFARLSLDAGGWAVAILLLSALVARQSLIRSRQLERLGKDLARQQQLLMRALDRTVEERRDERQLIGGHLHDDVLQSIIRVRMGVELLTSNPHMSRIDQREELRELDRAVEAAHDGLRLIIRGLRKSPLGSQGLVTALRSLVKDLKREWQSRIDLMIPADVDVPGVHQVALYQSAREALLNALKHAKATNVRVVLDQRGDTVSLEVVDDGVGFVPEQLSDRSHHFGLALLRERVTGLGGMVAIRSSKGNGTRVSVTLPLGRD